MKSDRYRSLLILKPKEKRKYRVFQTFVPIFISLRADVSKYRPEVNKREKSKILKKIQKVALGKLLT